MSLSAIYMTVGVYFLNVCLASYINEINGTRSPENVLDLIKLTFLPYLLFNLKKVRRKY